MATMCLSTGSVTVAGDGTVVGAGLAGGHAAASSTSAQPPARAMRRVEIEVGMAGEDTAAPTRPGALATYSSAYDSEAVRSAITATR